MTDEQSDTQAEEPLAEQSGTGGLTNQQRLIIIGAVVAMVLGFGVFYLVWASGRVSDDLADREARAAEAVSNFRAEQEPTATPLPSAPTPTPLPTVIADAPAGMAPLPGEVLVVNRVPGDDYGRLAIRHPDGTRTLLERTCMRVHIAAQHGVCLSQDDSLVPAYTTSFFPSNNPGVDLKQYASALPSRARVSPDGRFSSVTAFVSGSSYEDISDETTTIVTVDEIATNDRVRGATSFVVDSDDNRYVNGNAQYWGMTFDANNDFYITAFFDTAPEILSGSLSDRTMKPTGWVGSCPSLSPDGTTLVFKEMRADGGFDLVAIDLETDDKWILSETRSVDDQVEWLDNDTILYALHPEDGDTPVQPEFDIWMLDIEPGSEPVLFLPNADSPAVAR